MAQVATRTVVRDPGEMGRRIRIIRADLDWKLRDLARETGISYATWSRYEKGERFPSYEALLALADAIGTDTDALLGYWPSRAWSKRNPKPAAA